MEEVLAAKKFIQVFVRWGGVGKPKWTFDQPHTISVLILK